METSIFQHAKLALISLVGLSKDTLHVYFGLAAFVGVLLLTRRKPKSVLPLAAVLLLALCGEAVDARDDLNSLGHWRWDASMHDIWNTLFWPAVFWMLFRIGVFALVPKASRSEPR